MHEIRFEGTESVDEGDLRDVLKTRTKKWFAFWQKPPLLRLDFVRSDVETIRLFYARLGYLDAQVTSIVEREEDGDRATVVFRVQEGPRSHVGSIDLGPVRVFQAEELREELALHLGDPFNPTLVARDRERILELYADRGHFPLVQGRWSRDGTRVEIEFRIDEGPAFRVGEVTVAGVENVDTAVVRREVVLDEGKLFRRSDLQRSIERLYDTALFQVVDIEPTDVDTLAARVGARVSVREREHGWLEGGVGIGSAEGLRLLGEWGNRNLWGKGRRLSATSSISFGRLARFSNFLRYTEPWLFATRTRGEVTAFFEQREVQFRDAPFDQRSWGLTLAARRGFGRYARATLALQNTWADAVGEPVIDGRVPEDFEDRFFTRRVSLNLEYDERDDPFNPRRGQYYQAVGEVAGELLGSKGRFRKGTWTSAWYLPFGRRASLATRLRLGGIQPFGEQDSPLETVPIQDLFRTGGATTVRGYKEEGIVGADGTGGLLLVVTNVEARFPLAGVVSGALFLDGGNVWSRPRDFQLHQLVPPGAGGLLEANDMKWSVGGGLRVATPVGPIRFDYGYRLREERADVEAGRESERWGFHLSFGQAF